MADKQKSQPKKQQQPNKPQLKPQSKEQSQSKPQSPTKQKSKLKPTSPPKRQTTQALKSKSRFLAAKLLQPREALPVYSYRKPRDPENNEQHRKEIEEENRFQRNAPEDEALRHIGYKVGRLIGVGAFSKVYIAEYIDPSRKNPKPLPLALKLINGHNLDPYYLRHFLPRELDLLKGLYHTNIVELHSCIQIDLRFFLFMQLCERGDVLNYIREKGALKEHQALVWFTQCLKGLHFLNEKSIAHRDIKCENLLLSNSLNIRIADFGHARSMGHGEIVSDTYCGSKAYVAPEVIRGKSYDPRAADVWSLGVVLFVMLNKSLPFDDSDLKILYDSQISRKWALKPSVRRGLTEEAKNFLVEVLTPNPMVRKYPAELYQHHWIQSSIATVGELTNTLVPRTWVKGTGFVDDKQPVLGKTPTEVFQEPFAPARSSSRVRLESLFTLTGRVKSILPDYRNSCVLEPEKSVEGVEFVPTDPIVLHQQRYTLQHPPPRRTVIQAEMDKTLPESRFMRKKPIEDANMGPEGGRKNSSGQVSLTDSTRDYRVDSGMNSTDHAELKKQNSFMSMLQSLPDERTGTARNTGQTELISTKTLQHQVPNKPAANMVDKKDNTKPTPKTTNKKGQKKSANKWNKAMNKITKKRPISPAPAPDPVNKPTTQPGAKPDGNKGATNSAVKQGPTKATKKAPGQPPLSGTAKVIEPEKHHGRPSTDSKPGKPNLSTDEAGLDQPQNGAPSQNNAADHVPKSDSTTDLHSTLQTPDSEAVNKKQDPAKTEPKN